VAAVPSPVNDLLMGRGGHSMMRTGHAAALQFLKRAALHAASRRHTQSFCPFIGQLWRDSYVKLTIVQRKDLPVCTFFDLPFRRSYD
jgi:hypothetical protein